MYIVQIAWTWFKHRSQWEDSSAFERRIPSTCLSISFSTRALWCRSYNSLGDIIASLSADILILILIPVTIQPHTLCLYILSHFMQPHPAKTPLSTHKPPLPTPIPSKALSPRNNKSPHYTRTSSQNKHFKKTSLEKHQHDPIKHELKYSKMQQNPPVQRKSRLDESVSGGKAVTVNGWSKLEESQETVQRKHNSPTHIRSQSTVRDGWTSLDRTQRLDASRASRISQTHSGRRSSIDNKDEYYLYWKNKAHEYLQSNMKLMEEVKKLNQDNQDLKQQLQRVQRRSELIVQSSAIAFDEDKMVEQVRKNSMYYLTKIQTLEVELKRKQSVIVSYELKINELTKRVAGDLQRMRLVERIASDLQTKTPDSPKYWAESIRKTKKGQEGGGGRGALGLLSKW